MYSRIASGALDGVKACPVGVEVDVSQGLPAFLLVGSLGPEVREARERISVALKNAGFPLPPAHITVNLTPADRRKEGTAFDLAIAVGILQAVAPFPKEAAEDVWFLGELGLNGEVKGVRGVLPIVQEAAKRGVRECLVPAENAAEGGVVPGITVRGVATIGEALEFLRHRELGDCILPPVRVDVEKLFAADADRERFDFAQVAGQESARRGAEIAAAGFHNLLMVGPPGAGKSMIAKRIPGILPGLTPEESLEVTAVYSVAGKLEKDQALVTKRPFQSPHHTVSLPAMSGGSARPRPGVISLAHRGILFLDELPEFGRATLDGLRQPLEDRSVQIDRVGGHVTYPAEFMLVCAMNPCPCGFYPDRNRCKCTRPQIERYTGRISGPVLDRIDLWVELKAVDITRLQRTGKEPESSAEIRRRVLRAREFQRERFQGTRIRFNGDIEASDVERYCALGREETRLMERLYHSLNLSARAYHRVLKVARTVADLAGSERIGEEHLLEAAGYRPGETFLPEAEACSVEDRPLSEGNG